MSQNFHNRIARYGRCPATTMLFPAQATKPEMAAGPSRPPSLVIVPVPLQQSQWQAELYRWAYERALADLAPPRHFPRFFSVWN